MKDKTIDNNVLEYISGDLTADREEQLRSLLQKHGYEIDELNHLKKVYQRLDDVQIPRAGEKMTVGFYRKLEAYKRERAVQPTLPKYSILRLNAFN
ncbi:MAG: hypothetical protein JSU64_05975, partial [candidate division WOR-3 bacterium]